MGLAEGKDSGAVGGGAEERETRRGRITQRLLSFVQVFAIFFELFWKAGE